MNPFELFTKEFPQVSARFDELVDAQRALPALDGKTKRLINIAIQTAVRNPRGVRFHAAMARQAGASREETLGAVDEPAPGRAGCGPGQSPGCS